MLLGLLESLPSFPSPSHTIVSPSFNSGAHTPGMGPMALATVASPIRNLAPETLQEIIAFTPPESHLALSRVSKLLYALCLRSIYCNIELRAPASVVKCCRTLANNAVIASAVRSFVVSYTPPASPTCSSFYSLIGRALTRLSNVHHLLLLVPDPNYSSVLPHCSLPYLRHFECLLPLDDTMVSFLNHHRRIVYLQLGAQEEIPPPLDQTVTLPQLEYFIGNSSCVAPILHRASLRAAFITWDAVGETTGDSLAALQRSSGETLNLLSCRRPGWNLDLLERIAYHVPHIYALVLTNLFFVDVVLTHPTNLQAIGQYLARFSSLQRLEITCVNVHKPEDIPVPQMDSAFETVTAWGALCPSLTECTLPQANQVRWLRVSDDLWLPDVAQTESSNSALAVRWLWGVLRRGAYPGWTRVVQAVRSRGGDTYRQLEALQRGALQREYQEGDEDAAGVVGIHLGSAGWCV